MTDSRSKLSDDVHYVRLVESPVETSAVDRRNDYVVAPKRVIVMRPTTNTQFVVTSAIDLRDDVLRDEVPSIVGDACHGVLGAHRDAIVQAIEQDDTQPIRRLASGTTPPAMRGGNADKSRANDARDAPASHSLAHEVPAIHSVAHEVPAIHSVAHEVPASHSVAHEVPASHSVARDIAAMLDAVARRNVAEIRSALDAAVRGLAVERDAVTAMLDAVARRDVSAIRDALDRASEPNKLSPHVPLSLRVEPSEPTDEADGFDDEIEDVPSDDPLAMSLARGSSPALDRAVAFAIPMARSTPHEEPVVAHRMTMTNPIVGGRSR